MSGSRISLIQPYWPRRLLRVEGRTLTSVTRTGEATYGSDDRPQYNILTYTWGRFETPDGDAIVIEDIPWNVPKISPHHFTSEAFYAVIEHVSRGYGYIWLDVACIDQEDEAIKLSEIGHQAAIFHGAAQAYIWLSRCSGASFGRLYNLMRRYEDPLCWLRSLKNKVRSLRRALRTIQDFLQDPWLSSLWTLQEAWIRPDAILVVGMGMTFPNYRRPEDGTLFLRLEGISDFFRRFWVDLSSEMARDELYGRLRKNSGIKASLAKQIQDIIQRSGLVELYDTNGLMLYELSLRRTVREPLDRVYGVMQAFGLALGATAPGCPAGRKFTIEDLEDQLGAALNNTSPVYAQMFVRKTDPRPRRSWCLGSEIWVPGRLVMAVSAVRPTNACRVTFDDAAGTARYEGSSGTFEALCGLWNAGWVCWGEKGVARDKPTYYIHLDQTTRNRRAVPAAMLEDGSWDGLPGELEQSIKNEYGERLRVLLVGKTRDMYLGRHQSYCWVGLIVSPALGEDASGSLWVRIGVCLWEVVDENLEKEQEEFLSPCNLLLG